MLPFGRYTLCCNLHCSSACPSFWLCLRFMCKIKKHACRAEQTCSTPDRITLLKGDITCVELHWVQHITATWQRTCRHEMLQHKNGFMLCILLPKVMAQHEHDELTRSQSKSNLTITITMQRPRKQESCRWFVETVLSFCITVAV